MHSKETETILTLDAPFEGFSGLHDYNSQASLVQLALVMSKGNPEKFFKLLKADLPLSIQDYVQNLHSSQAELKNRISEDMEKYPERVKKIDELMALIKTTDSLDIVRESYKDICVLLKKSS